MQTVPLKDIRIDGGTQPRVSIQEDAVADYADGYRIGAALPPVDVFWDGAEFWLADGFHRFHAMKKIGAGSIRATVHQGTRRDAVLFSVSANQGQNALRRTNEDKRKAIRVLVNDTEWGLWSNREIARRCDVLNSHWLDVISAAKTSRDAAAVVDSANVTIQQVDSEPNNRSAMYTTKHGTKATMEVSKIGRRAPRHPKDEPSAPSTFESSRMMAIDGAGEGLLKKLPRRAAAEQVESAVHALQGIASVMAQINAADLAEHPDAVRWHRAISDVVGVLRAFVRPLLQAEKKDVA